ncbi:hypothetical protein AHF37_00772, partial [Paragonimus kellicotti]
GNRIAKSNSVADLLGSDFQIVINEDRFNVDSSAIGTPLIDFPANPNGNRIAKSNSVADLLGSDFQIVINEDRFNVDSSASVRL